MSFEVCDKIVTLEDNFPFWHKGERGVILGNSHLGDDYFSIALDSGICVEAHIEDITYAENE